MITLISDLLGAASIGAILREDHESLMTLTEIPLESGSRISDHCIIEPKRVSLEIAAADAVAAWNAIVLFQRTRIPFVMVTGLTIYTEMIIVRASATRDASTGSVLRAIVELQEAVRVGNSFASIAAGVASLVASGIPGGANSTGAANPTSEVVADSIADRATGTLQLGDQALSAVPAAEATSVLGSFF